MLKAYKYRIYPNNKKYRLRKHLVVVLCQILSGSRLRFYLPPAKILVLRNEVLCDGGRLGKWQVSGMWQKKQV